MMKSTILAGLLLVCLAGSSCVPGQSFDARLSSIVQPYHFSIAGWELRVLLQETSQWLFSRQKEADDEVQLVISYFNNIERIRALKSEIETANSNGSSGESSLVPLKDELNELEEQNAALAGKVERIIERQIRNTLTEQGIYNPAGKTKAGFPPVNFKLEQLPFLLVISPRERIESMREITLESDLTLEEKEEIEARADGLGVSSLVVEIGGIATYPTLVDNEASLRTIINTTAEEWLHQYLAFKPLGFRYLLDLTGLSRNYEIATMNETVAGMVSKEIGSLVFEKYYSEYESSATPVPEPEFDFNQEMREIRRAVDSYLARGEITQAEEFMEQKRQYLASMGYYIRKLNQAYFAFHGAYADKPSSISPIGLELQELRNQSASLKDFLNAVAAMTSRQELRKSIK